MKFIDARIGTGQGSPIPDEFELPRRFNERVREFFAQERRAWRRPAFPDQVSVARLRFRSDGNRSLQIDIYDAGRDANGVGTSGHRFLFNTPGKGMAELLTMLEQARTWMGVPEVSEITLSRSPCFGSRPVDTVVIRSDGTAEYEGHKKVNVIGRHKGIVSQVGFRKLIKLIDDNGLAGMDGRYSHDVTDVATETTTVRWGQKLKKTENDGRAGPVALNEIQDAIVTLAKTIKWTPVP